MLGSWKNGKPTGGPLSVRAIKKRIVFLDLSQLDLGDQDLSPTTDAARNGTDPFRLQETGG